jgi:hypothetical protein
MNPAMNLEQLQRAFFEMTRQPLTPAEGTRTRALDGRLVRDVADQIIKPNDRLTSFERLEIYNRQYWFRLLSCMYDDFPGLRAIVGEKQFEKLTTAHLLECPSQSFTLRDLGSRLESWLPKHLEFVPRGLDLIALDMVRLEWADIEAYDDAELPKLTEKDLQALGEDPVLHLQPHMRLLALAYPVDTLLISLREKEHETDIVSNAVTMHTRRTRIRKSSLPKAEKTYVVVYRLDESVYFKRLEPEAFALLKALREGKPLSQAIESSLAWSKQPVGKVSEQLRDWFANWASLGWFAKPQ